MIRTEIHDLSKPEAYNKLGLALRQPEKNCDLSALAAAAKLRHIHVRMTGLAAFARDPGLLGRIRGAFGASLGTSASQEALNQLPCPWDPPCAFDAIFRKQGRMTPGIDFPSPWFIAADPVRGDLVLTLTLFGMATEWAPAAAEAFTEALLNRVDWVGKTNLFLPKLEISTRKLEAVDGLIFNSRDPQIADHEIEFLSPLVISNVDAIDDPVPAFTGLGHRLEGVARWHNCTLEETNWNAVTAEVRRHGFEWAESQYIQWPRGSKRQDKSINMGGVIGRLSIDGDHLPSSAMTALIELGAAFRIGADVSFGCGRYRILRS